MTMAAGAPFRYEDLPALTRFGDVLDEARYRPVPLDWSVALCDFVDSSGAIGAGLYRSVNYGAAAAIAAVRNALPASDIPFVFGGDGATFLLAPDETAPACSALAAVVQFARERLDLELRAALVPLTAVHGAGLDVRVARFEASPDASYAMIRGGGLAWAEAALKAGRYALPPAPRAAEPDLTGLSCRFEATPATNGTVLSLIVVPRDEADPPAVRQALAAILGLIGAEPASGRPLPETGPSLGLRPSQVIVRYPGRGVLARGASVIRRWLVSTGIFALFKSGLPLGRFSPARYMQEVVANADYRKYDDGLRMTVDCTAETAALVERRLAEAEAAGLLHFGISRQGSAVTTCFSTPRLGAGHLHFVDGGDGGYAEAARRLKVKLRAGSADGLTR